MTGDDGKHLNPALFTTRDERLGREAERRLVAGAVAGTLRFNTDQPTVEVGGHVFRRKPNIVVCPKCHGLRTDMGGPHAPRFNDNNQRVDCVGELLNTEAT